MIESRATAGEDVVKERNTSSRKHSCVARILHVRVTPNEILTCCREVLGVTWGPSRQPRSPAQHRGRSVQHDPSLRTGAMLASSYPAGDWRIQVSASYDRSFYPLYAQCGVCVPASTPMDGFRRLRVPLSQAGGRRKQGLTPPTKLPASLSSLLGEGDVANGKRKGGSISRRGQSVELVPESELANGNGSNGGRKKGSVPKKRVRDDGGGDDEEGVEGDEDDSNAFFDAKERNDDDDDDDCGGGGDHEPLADDKRAARVYGRGRDGRDEDSKARRSPRNIQGGGEKATSIAGKAQKKGRSSSAESPLRFRLEVSGRDLNLRSEERFDFGGLHQCSASVTIKCNVGGLFGPIGLGAQAYKLGQVLTWVM